MIGLEFSTLSHWCEAVCGKYKHLVRGPVAVAVVAEDVGKKICPIFLECSAVLSYKDGITAMATSREAMGFEEIEKARAFADNMQNVQPELLDMLDTHDVGYVIGRYSECHSD